MNERIGECQLSNQGEDMVIADYRNSKDIDVYFPKYNYTNKNKTYQHFKSGNIRCPYTKNVYNIGYLGEGEYQSKENGRITKTYNVWRDMIRRCYSNENKSSFNTYKNCIVCEEWHNFQNFAKWFEENYYEVDDEKMELDKDILVKGNKVYSPSTCVFVTSGINNIFTKSNSIRGEYPIGISYRSKENKFVAICKTNKDKDYLGYFDKIEDAFNTYKVAKEEYIKQIANEYKNKIPQKLYNSMITYEVEITD